MPTLMVATGVGVSITSVSQPWVGNCADLSSAASASSEIPEIARVLSEAGASDGGTPLQMDALVGSVGGSAD